MNDFDKNSKTAHIIYLNYLTSDGTKMSIGGIQTYITNLSSLLMDMGYKVSIYQRSTTPFHVIFDNKEIYGIVCTKAKSGKIGSDLFYACLNRFDRSKDILIFGCESLICNTKGIRFIAIQHGITWDKPINGNQICWMLRKFYIAWNAINRIKKADTLICVDNNFINWYRAMVAKPTVKIINIPNFAEISMPITKPQDNIIRIIFARRLFDYRGTRIFTKAVLRLLDEFDNIRITIAGDGPDKEFMTKELGIFNNVKFITYASGDSLIIHEDKDIAVIPTLGSEGTSLSLLEAMSAQCAVICTNVGGMTNVVIDHYNGLMINPDENSLYDAMKELISNPELRKTLSLKGYETLKNSFSLSKWSISWKRALLEFLK